MVKLLDSAPSYCPAPRLHPGRTVATLLVGCFQVCMESGALMHELRIWKQVLFLKYSHHSVDWSLSCYLCSRWLTFVVLDIMDIQPFISIEIPSFHMDFIEFSVRSGRYWTFSRAKSTFSGHNIHEVVAFSTVKPCILFIAYMRPSARTKHAENMPCNWRGRCRGGKICICIHGFGRNTRSQWKVLTTHIPLLSKVEPRKNNKQTRCPQIKWETVIVVT